jgi:hypothetical protein
MNITSQNFGPKINFRDTIFFKLFCSFLKYNIYNLQLRKRYIKSYEINTDTEVRLPNIATSKNDELSRANYSHIKAFLGAQSNSLIDHALILSAPLHAVLCKC